MRQPFQPLILGRVVQQAGLRSPATKGGGLFMRRIMLLIAAMTLALLTV
jgi:hypothetical protein